MSLFIFDKDGTLVKLKPGWMGIGQPVASSAEQELKTGVFGKMAELRAAGHKIAIASNQKLVAMGVITLEEAEALMEDCVKKIGGADAWRICPFDAHAKPNIDGHPNPYRLENDCHKPKPGMLLELMSILGFPPGDTYMVGDSWRDRYAAKNAHISYLVPRWFFREYE